MFLQHPPENVDPALTANLFLGVQPVWIFPVRPARLLWATWRLVAPLPAS